MTAHDWRGEMEMEEARERAEAEDLAAWEEDHIERHQQLRDWACWRQLQRIGDYRENAQIIERETEVIQRLLAGRSL